jgi:hypothetical protein
MRNFGCTVEDVLKRQFVRWKRANCLSFDQKYDDQKTSQDFFFN